MEVKWKNDEDSTFYLKNSNHSLEYSLKFINDHLMLNKKSAICLMDISNFKSYNYMFGYEYGNKILEIAFNKLTQCIGNNGYIHRFRNDIFLLILQDIKYIDDAKTVIKKIIDSFCNTIIVNKQKLMLLINIGIAMYPDDNSQPNTLLQYAEIALNYTKNARVSRYSFFNLDMFGDVIKKGKIQMDLGNAMYNNEFMVYYQPLVDISTMRVYGMEALLRWNHPQKGLLTPGHFIDVIEESGMIYDVGKYVLNEACMEIVRCNSKGNNELSISINVSDKQLEDKSFLFYVEDIIKRSKVDPKKVSIEITERVILNMTDEVLNNLISLRSKGIKILIDDFGTKYSSLNYLYTLPVDGIKIDKSFIDRIQNSKKELIVIKNIVRLARELELDVIAEGVETNEQLNCLRRIGCNKIQGFIFAKPVSPNEIVDTVNKFNS